MAKYKVIFEVEVTKDSLGEAPISPKEIKDYVKSEVERKGDLRILNIHARGKE